MTSQFRMTGLALLSMAALAMAGCSDAAGPSDVFDPVTTNESAQNVLSKVASNQAIQSISVLASAFPSFGGSPALLIATLPPASLEQASERMWLGDRVRFMSQTLSLEGAAAPAVIFPADHLGKTFVLNPATGQYEIDDSRTGAPANGVRLILYAVDPILHATVEPLVEIGYLDLTDESTPSADAIGIEAVISGTTILDYDASATVTTTSVTFSAVGFLVHEGTQVDFNLSQSFSESDGISIDYLVSAPSEDASIRLEIDAAPASESASITLTVEHNADIVVLHIEATAGSIEGSVTFNGELVILISGTEADPVFTDREGNPISPEDLEALHELFQSAEEVFGALDDLLEPAYHVLQLPRVYAF